MGFREIVESQMNPSLGTLGAAAAEPALAQIQMLRADLNARANELAVAVLGTQRVEAERLRELTDQLTRAAAEETKAAVEKASLEAAEMGRACLEFERAEAQKGLDFALAEVATAHRLERVALSTALEHAKVQLEAAKAAQAQLLESTRAQIEEAREQAMRAIEDARTQLKGIRTELHHAAAEAKVAEAAAHARLEAARLELEGEREAATKKQAAMTEALEAVRKELDVARTAAQERIDSAQAAQTETLTEQTGHEEELGSDRARQYARLLMSEIARYPQPNVPTFVDPCLSDRLTDAIEQWAASPASDHPAKLSRLLSVQTSNP